MGITQLVRREATHNSLMVANVRMKP